MGNCSGTKSKYEDFQEPEDIEMKAIKMLTHYGRISDNEKNMIDKINEIKKDKDYENLVLSGGGIKTFAYCGSLQVLEELGILKKIKRYAGSSAGAIICTMLAIGYTAYEIRNIMYNTDFNSLLHLHSTFGIAEDALKISKNFGCDTGDSFESFIENLIKHKTGNSNYTFNDLYEKQKKELVITGTDINRELTIYFNYLNHPNMPLKEAVRISMSIPIIFMPVKHNNDYYVDGGMLDNYCIHVFDGEYAGDIQAKLNLIPINPKTLGIRIISDDQKANFELVKRSDVTDFKSYVIRLVDTLYSNNEREYMRPSYWKRTIEVKVPNIPLTQFYLDNKTKDLLQDNGRDAVVKYFDQ